MADYEVIRPEESQRLIGRSYQDLIESWAQWIVSDNPDAHNYGNVIFLRGMDFPRSPERIGYSGQPAMMIGTRALNIVAKDQYLFLPVICTFVNEIDDRAKTIQEQSYLIWRDTMEGDNPPSTNQIFIDEEPLDRAGSDLSGFLTWSRGFMLHVPDVPYGRSLKDYLDIPISTPGDLQTMIGGYAILFRFTDEVPKDHSLIFHARGIQGPAGQYLASGVYTIHVSPSPPSTSRLFGTSTILSETVKQRMLHELDNRKEKGEISNEEYDKLKTKIESMNETVKQRMLHELDNRKGKISNEEYDKLKTKIESMQPI
jgi:hypothetical protein